MNGRTWIGRAGRSAGAGLLAGAVATAAITHANGGLGPATLASATTADVVLFALVTSAVGAPVGTTVALADLFGLVTPALALIAVGVRILRTTAPSLGNDFVGVIGIAVVLLPVVLALGGIEYAVRRYGGVGPDPSFPR